MTTTSRVWRFGKHAALLVVPLCVAFFSFLFRAESGPFWLGSNLDPEYAYLANSLALSAWLPVGHGDHPGSTLQWLGSPVLTLTHWITGQGSLVSDVLTRSEFYLHVLHGLLVLLLCGALWMFGWMATQSGGSLWIGSASQAVILFGMAARSALPRMSPEPLLLTLVLCFAGLVLYHQRLGAQPDGKGPDWQYGFVSGLGVALKLTFLPLLVIPLILLRGLRQRLVFFASFVATLLTLTANPMMKTDVYKPFLGSLVTRTGYNAPQTPGADRLQAMLDGMEQLASRSWIYEKPLLLLLVLFGITGFLLLKSQGAPKAAQFRRRVWLGILIAFVGQFVLVANAPRASHHYITPVLGLLGLVVVLARQALTHAERSKVILGSLKWSFVSVFALALLLAMADLESHRRKMIHTSDDWLEAAQFRKDHQLTERATVFFYRASHPAFAWEFGNYSSRRGFARELKALHPNIYRLNTWNGRIHTGFEAVHVPLDALLERYGEILIQGSRADMPKIATDRSLRTATGRVLQMDDPMLVSSEILFEGSVESIMALRLGEPPLPEHEHVPVPPSGVGD